MLELNDFFSEDDLWHSVGHPISGIGRGRYRLTPLYLFFEKGTLSTAAEQVPVAEVYDVDVKQTMVQKARGVGTVTITVNRTNGREVVRLEDIPDFRDAQRVINDAAHAARIRIRQVDAQFTNTHRTENVNLHRVETLATQNPVAISGVPAELHDEIPSAPDPIDQLRRLAELRDLGVLTLEEFEAKKTEILGRL